jgi:hypothetical protein
VRCWATTPGHRTPGAALKATGLHRHREVDLPVRDLDDTTMALMMAQENMEEWDSSALVEQETIRAIVEGYAAGRIKLPRPDKKTPRNNIRYAPSFQIGHQEGCEGDVAFTSLYL